LKTGVDRAMWGSKPDKNGVFKWYRYNEPANMFIINKFWLSKQDYSKHNKYNYKEFLKKYKSLAKSLLKQDIYLYYMDHEGQYVNEHYFAEYLWDDVEEDMKYTYKIDDMFSKSVLMIDDFKLWKAAENGSVDIQHHILKKDKIVVQQALINTFGARKVIIPKGRSKMITIKIGKN